MLVGVTRREANYVASSGCSGGVHKPFVHGRSIGFGAVVASFTGCCNVGFITQAGRKM